MSDSLIVIYCGQFSVKDIQVNYERTKIRDFEFKKKKTLEETQEKFYSNIKTGEASEKENICMLSTDRDST